MVDTKPDVLINTQNVNGNKNETNQNPIRMDGVFSLEKVFAALTHKWSPVILVS